MAKIAPEKVLPGKTAAWFLAACVVSVACIVVAVALQLVTHEALHAPLLIIPAFVALVCLPSVFRNRVELYPDHLDVVYGFSRISIPYDQVVGVRRVQGRMKVVASPANSFDRVLVEAPMAGDAMISVQDPDLLIAELKNRCALMGKNGSFQMHAVPPRERWNGAGASTDPRQ